MATQRSIRSNPVLVVFLASLVSGCGINFTAKKAQHDLQELKDPGIYYSLPRTQVHVAIPVSLEVLVAGRVGAVYEGCLKACQRDTTAAPKQCVFPEPLKIRVLRPEVTLKGVPDARHTYFVAVENEPFTSVKHKMTFNESGVIAAAESGGSSVAYEVAAGVIKEVLKLSQIVESTKATIASVRTNGGPPRPQPKPPTPPAEVADDAKFLPCENAQRIKAGLQHFKDLAMAERAKLDIILAPGKKPINADYAKLVIARVSERASAIEADSARFRADSDLEVVKKTFDYKLVGASPLEPDDFKVKKGHELNFSEEAPADVSQAKTPRIAPILKDERISFSADIEPTDLLKPCESSACAIPPDSGYRYRIPRQGKLTIRTVKAEANASMAVEHVLLQGVVPIGQYGPVAALPSRFVGKGGSVEFSISGVTGALTSVTIGADAAPASSVLGPLESLRSAIEVREVQKEKNAESQRNSEKNELERERDLLKLRKEIRELNDALGK